MNDMKRSKDNHDNSKKVLDNFIPIDGAIDLSIQEEYFSFPETTDYDDADYEEVKCLRELRFTSATVEKVLLMNYKLFSWVI